MAIVHGAPLKDLRNPRYGRMGSNFMPKYGAEDLALGQNRSKLSGVLGIPFRNFLESYKVIAQVFFVFENIECSMLYNSNWKFKLYYLNSRFSFLGI